MTDEQQVKEWHLDRRVTLALIVALLANAGATIWWASKIEQRVTVIEAQGQRPFQNTERIVRVEEQIDNAVRSLVRIEQKLDRVIEEKK